MKEDLTLDPRRAVLGGTLVGLVALAAVIVPHRWLHGEDALGSLFEALGWWLAPAIVVGIVAHEAIHALTWCLAARLRFADVAFGVNWRLLMPFAHPRVPMPARASAAGAVAPGLVLGVEC